MFTECEPGAPTKNSHVRFFVEFQNVYILKYIYNDFWRKTIKMRFLLGVPETSFELESDETSHEHYRSDCWNPSEQSNLSKVVRGALRVCALVVDKINSKRKDQKSTVIRCRLSLPESMSVTT